MWVYAIWSFAFAFVPFAINSISVYFFYCSGWPSFLAYSHHDCTLRAPLLYASSLLKSIATTTTITTTKGLTRTKNGITFAEKETLQRWSWKNTFRYFYCFFGFAFAFSSFSFVLVAGRCCNDRVAISLILSCDFAIAHKCVSVLPVVFFFSPLHFYSLPDGCNGWYIVSLATREHEHKSEKSAFENKIKSIVNAHCSTCL